MAQKVREWLMVVGALLAGVVVGLSGGVASGSSAPKADRAGAGFCPAFAEHEGDRVVPQERIAVVGVSCSAAHWFIVHLYDLARTRYVLDGHAYRVRGGWRCTDEGGAVRTRRLLLRTRCVGGSSRRIEWVSVQPVTHRA